MGRLWSLDGRVCFPAEKVVGVETSGGEFEESSLPLIQFNRPYVMGLRLDPHRYVISATTRVRTETISAMPATC